MTAALKPQCYQGGFALHTANPPSPAAPHAGVAIMACPGTLATLQSRQELLSTITTVYGVLRERMDRQQLLMVVRWLDRFARYPVGAEDTSSIHFSTIGPIQKAALQGFAALPPLPPAALAAGTEGSGDAWQGVLGVLCNMLRPYSTLALRQHAQQAAAMAQSGSGVPRRSSVPTAVPHSSSSLSQLDLQSGTAGSTPTHHGDAGAASSGARSPLRGAGSRQGTGDGSGHAPEGEPTGAAAAAAAAEPSDVMLEARAMTPMWMTRVVEMLAAWYRDQVTWQVGGRCRTRAVVQDTCRAVTPGQRYPCGGGNTPYPRYGTTGNNLAVIICHPFWTTAMY